MKDLRTLYPPDTFGNPDKWNPDCDDDENPYWPFLRSFGFEVVLQEDRGNYQGDSLALFRGGEYFGVLTFGWGSCSGCDAWQGAHTYEDLEALRAELMGDIVWGTVEETRRYLTEHDWDGTFLDKELVAAFVPKALAILEAAG